MIVSFVHTHLISVISYSCQGFFLATCSTFLVNLNTEGKDSRYTYNENFIDIVAEHETVGWCRLQAKTSDQISAFAIKRLHHIIRLN